jgi:hypothetical protein
MSEIQAKLDYAEAIADWFLDLSEAHILRGELEEGLQCIHIAANILCRQNRLLSSARIESNLQSVAHSLGENHGLRSAVQHKSEQTETCLHVITHALPLGGATAMATRWMGNDRSGGVHNVALLSQEVPVPDQLRQAARVTGGVIYTADPKESFLQRAVWLRNLANELASFVVLHIDVSDVIAGVAFGINGGPPVLLVNHAAHLFWTGASVTDLIVNCRGSALEAEWAETYRGTSRYATIPIPLPEPSLSGSDKSLQKNEAKKKIGLPENSVVILTVGAAFKYLPANGLDFIEVCEHIIKELPEAHVLVVGLREDEHWQNASRRSGSRIRALGTLSQTQLATVQQATDIYIEGFPFGTTTSLLEAGLQGIPAILAPAECPPPYGTDGVAVDDVLERPASVAEYEEKVVLLGRSVADRERWGSKLRAAIIQHHTGSGWNQYLDSAIKKLPQQHLAYPPPTPVRTPTNVHEYWSSFLIKWSWAYEETLENAVMHAFSVGLRPRLTKRVNQACRDFRSIRSHCTVPLPLVALLCNFSVLPAGWAGKPFWLCAFLFRRSLFSRVRKRFVRLFRKTHRPARAYQEYLQMPPHRELFLGKIPLRESEQIEYVHRS